MPYPIERKLVIAVSSSALFDLSESHSVFVEKGPKAYKKFQEEVTPWTNLSEKSYINFR